MNLLSIAEISKELGAPDSTIRRYVKLFGKYLPEGVQLGKTTKYPASISKTLKSINLWFKSGLSHREVEDKISIGEEVSSALSQEPQRDKFTALSEDIRDLIHVVRDLNQTIATTSQQGVQRQINEKLNLLLSNITSTTQPPLNEIELKPKSLVDVEGTTQEPAEKEMPFEDETEHGIPSDNTATAQAPTETPESETVAMDESVFQDALDAVYTDDPVPQEHEVSIDSGLDNFFGDVTEESEPELGIDLMAKNKGVRPGQLIYRVPEQFRKYKAVKQFIKDALRFHNPVDIAATIDYLNLTSTGIKSGSQFADEAEDALRDGVYKNWIDIEDLSTPTEKPIESEATEHDQLISLVPEQYRGDAVQDFIKNALRDHDAGVIAETIAYGSARGEYESGEDFAEDLKYILKRGLYLGAQEDVPFDKPDPVGTAAEADYPEMETGQEGELLVKTAPDAVLETSTSEEIPFEDDDTAIPEIEISEEDAADAVKAVDELLNEKTSADPPEIQEGTVKPVPDLLQFEDEDSATVSDPNAPTPETVKASPDALLETSAPNAVPETPPTAKQVIIEKEIDLFTGDEIPKPEPLPDCHGKKLTVEERDVFLLQVEALYPGQGMFDQRAEALNAAGITTGRGKAWIGRNVRNNLKAAYNRKKKQS